MTNRGLKLSSFIPFVLGLACMTREVPDDASGVDAGVGSSAQDAAVDTDARPTATKLPPPIRKELGAACSGAGDCASGFCVDGLCCDSACDAACMACDLSASPGRCAALDGVADLSAVPPCTGTRICAKDVSGASACRLTDGEACVQSGDCASGWCRAYYRDQDVDGYGADGAETLHRCDATARPPQGFSAAAGDCCDTDSAAHPGVSAYFTTRDACGGFDWNCSGADERAASGTCPTASGLLACGQACSIGFKGTVSTVFVQACH